MYQYGKFGVVICGETKDIMLSGLSFPVCQPHWAVLKGIKVKPVCQ